MPTAKADIVKPDLASLQTRLADAILSAPDSDGARASALEILQALTNAEAVFYLTATAPGGLVAVRERSGASDAWRALRGALDVCARSCMADGCARVDRAAAQTVGTLICVPVPGQGPADVLALIVGTGGQPVEPFVVTAQLVASFLAFRGAQGGFGSPPGGLPAALSGFLQQAGDGEACYCLVAGVARQFRCSRSALALGRKQPLALCALSDSTGFDRRSRIAEALTAALEEALGRGGEIRYPPPAEPESTSSCPAHGELSRLMPGHVFLTVPLQTSAGEALGAWLFAWEAAQAPSAATAEGLRSLCSTVASVLDLWTRARMGVATRLARVAADHWRSLAVRRRVALVACVAVLLGLPVFPGYTPCDCSLRPVITRTVCAPFHGILEKTFVKPGDRIAAGQVLARMDDRDIRGEHASLAAEKLRAEKLVRANRAAGHVAASKLAECEQERMEHRIALLDRHIALLDIRAPIAGVVLSGDLDRAQGAPLQTGQVLYEIAPLQSMLAEIYVPDSEIAGVAVGAKVRLRWDSSPDLSFQGRVERIHPASILVDRRNVFCAEVTLENPEERLRPGMKGKARVAGPRRSLLGILLRRPWSILRDKLGGF